MKQFQKKIRTTSEYKYIYYIHEVNVINYNYSDSLPLSDVVYICDLATLIRTQK